MFIKQKNSFKLNKSKRTSIRVSRKIQAIVMVILSREVFQTLQANIDFLFALEK
jgi:hypothetical protein